MSPALPPSSLPIKILILHQASTEQTKRSLADDLVGKGIFVFCGVRIWNFTRMLKLYLIAFNFIVGSIEMSILCLWARDNRNDFSGCKH